MNPRLRSLLLAVGATIAAGTSVIVAIPRVDVTRADLVDAGLADCPRRHLLCDVRVSDEGRNVLADAGITVTRRYVPMRVRGRLCTETRAPIEMPNGLLCPAGMEEETDGGCTMRTLVLPVPPEGREDLRALHVNPDACEPVAHDGRDLPAFEPVTSRCVAASAAGCRRSEGDGGFRFFGLGNSFPRGESNGHASCVAAPCVVLAGERGDE